MNAPTPLTRPPRFVLMPGDTRFNLGDIAICLAILRLLRRQFPACTIAVWGKRPCVGSGFESVQFTTGILAMRTALAADVLVWGGGQLLQGNRSRVKIPYWLARVVLLRLLGKRIVGFGQGLGPFPSPIDRLLVRLAVLCTHAFTVRDRDSLQTLLDIGAPAERVHLAADPALLLATQPLAAPATAAAARPRLGLSLRYTRHHRRRLIPFQFLPARWQRRILHSADVHAYVDCMAALCDRLVERLGVDLVLVPMYYAPWETDVPLARALALRMRHRDRVHLVEARENLAEVEGALSRLDAFIGTPMHSTILATSRYVPTIALHYEPKGCEYLKRIGMEHWAVPLEGLWKGRGLEELEARVLELWARRSQVRQELRERVPDLRRQASTSTRFLHAALQE